MNDVYWKDTADHEQYQQQLYQDLSVRDAATLDTQMGGLGQIQPGYKDPRLDPAGQHRAGVLPVAPLTEMAHNPALARGPVGAPMLLVPPELHNVHSHSDGSAKVLHLPGDMLGGDDGAVKGDDGSDSAMRRTVLTTKRAAQNRNAQKAFRQRRHKYVKDLEAKAMLVPELEKTVELLQRENRQLREYTAALQRRLMEFGEGGPG